MSVGSNTYGSVAGVEKLVGDLVSSRTFSGSTVPTTTQVESVLDDIAMDLNRELEASGYTVPCDSTSYPTAYGFLTAANNFGAAAVILGMLPTGAYNPEEDIETGGTTRQETYSRRFNHALSVIAKNRLKAGRDRLRMQDMKAGARLDSNGYEKTPFFTRTLHEYPGVRTTTQEAD